MHIVFVCLFNMHPKYVTGILRKIKDGIVVQIKPPTRSSVCACACVCGCIVFSWNVCILEYFWNRETIIYSVANMSTIKDTG